MPDTSLNPTTFAIRGKRIHYAWAMVVIAAIMRLSTSAFRSSQSVLIPRLVESFGWSYGGVGGAFALQWVVSGMFGPPSGWLGDRYWWDAAFGKKKVDLVILLDDAIDRQPATWTLIDVALDLFNFCDGQPRLVIVRLRRRGSVNGESGEPLSVDVSRGLQAP